MKLSAKAQAALDTVVHKFETGDLSDVVQALAILPTADAPCLKWTFTNRALIAAQKFTQDARGFAQWREAGRKVKKGATAAYLFAPYMKAKGDKGAAEVERDAQGRKKYELKGWTTVPVFAYQDTEPVDPDVPSTVDYAPSAMPPLFDVAVQLGMSVSYAPHGGKVNGVYLPGSQALVLNVTTHRTFWHELAHAAHHHAEVADFLPQDECRETVAYHEAVAELTAAVLGEMYGEPCVGTSYHYLATYYKDPLVGITQALGVVGKVLAVITGLAEVQESVAA